MSARYFGGLVRKDPLVLNPAAGNAANGVFTMSQYMQAVKAATWPAYDPYFNETVLLLHGNGTNGAQNNTFLDSSSNNFTITRNGNTTQGTFSPFSLAAGEWSNYFDGTTDMLSLPSNAAFQYGTGDYTYEFWVYHTSLSGQQTYFSRNASGNASGVYIYKDTSNFVGVYYSSQIATSSVTINANQWYHIVVSRLSGTLRIFIDGVQRASVSDTTNLTESIVRIGADGSTALHGFAGYISNARILKGVGYSSVTVPTTPLTNITNTSLLTCQSNRFVDNSTNAFAITRNGDVRVTPFSPFAPSAAYSASTNGGSGYLDGTGDYLTVANNAAFDVAGGDFTIEGWFYQESAASKQLFSKRADTTTLAPFFLSIDTAGNMNFLGSLGTGSWDVNMTASGANIARIASWNHIAITRSGNVYTFFVNGASAATTTVAGSLMTNTGALSIGAGSAAGTSPYNGYIFNFRFVKGVAVYTGAFTPPTLPLSTSGAASASAYPSTTNVNTSFASSATSLLCNFTNAGIFDNTGKNNLETVGNAQIDTGTKKYGTGSMEFDGTGDYLAMPLTPDLTFGSGDFTIEGWINPSATVGGVFYAVAGNRTGDTNVTIGWTLFHYNSNVYGGFSNGTTSYTSQNTTTISTGTWYHIALVRSGSNLTMYVNGTGPSATSVTGSVNIPIAQVLIGAVSGGGLVAYNGYIDDLRITKGVARYTANFTAQTSQWQDQ
jgi:hypothetical protein